MGGPQFLMWVLIWCGHAAASLSTSESGVSPRTDLTSLHHTEQKEWDIQYRQMDTEFKDLSGILDVMFLFTPQALAAVGGGNHSMTSMATYSVQLANDAYMNSNIPIRMRMVGAFLVQDASFVETGFQSELNHLRNADGVLDADVSLRSAVGADSVVLFVAESGYCGLSVQGASVESAFAVVSTQCPSSVVHEVGHNMGCEHDRLTAANYNLNKYNFGYCWDTSSTTCSRSVMAYGGCVTPNKQTNCAQVPYFSSPLIPSGALGKATGLATADNARFISEQALRVTNWAPSKSNSGMLYLAQPSTVAVGRCEPVTIRGWRLGNGSDIVIVTLNGVPVQRIFSQTMDSVQVLVGSSDAVGIGDIIVTTSAGRRTTLPTSFAYEPLSAVSTSEFDVNVDPYWTPGGALHWSVLRYCDSLPCAVPPASGPSVGAGGSGSFAKLAATEVSGESGWLEAAFNANEHGCAEHVHSVSLLYHMWNPHAAQCVSSLTISVQSLTTGLWSSVATAASTQIHQDDLWLPLRYSFPDPADVRVVRLTATPFIGMAMCTYWSSVSVDHIEINKTASCADTGCDLQTPYPSASPSVRPSRAPTFAPTSIAPSVVPTASPTLELVQAVEVVSFTTTLTLHGVSSFQLLAQPAAVKALLEYIADTINVAMEDLCCLHLADATEPQRSLQANAEGARTTATYGTRLSVQRFVPLNLVGEQGPASPAGLASVDRAARLLSAAVLSGRVAAAVESALTNKGAPLSVTVDPLNPGSFSSLQSVLVLASGAPTAAPTSRTGAAAREPDDGWSRSTVGILTVACLMLLALGVVVSLACVGKIKCCAADKGFSCSVEWCAIFKPVRGALQHPVESGSEIELGAAGAIPQTVPAPFSKISELIPASIEALYSPRHLSLSRSRSASTPRNAYQHVRMTPTDDADEPPYQDILDRVNQSHAVSTPRHSTPRAGNTGDYSRMPPRMPRSAPLPFPPSISTAVHGAQGLQDRQALSGRSRLLSSPASTSTARSTPTSGSSSREGSPRGLLGTPHTLAHASHAPHALQIAPPRAFLPALTVDTNGAPILLRGQGPGQHRSGGTPTSAPSSGRAPAPPLSGKATAGNYHALLAKRLESPNAVAGFSPTSTVQSST